MYSVPGTSSLRGNVIEPGCEHGYEDFRSSVIWEITAVALLEKRFGKSSYPSAVGPALQRRGRKEDQIVNYTDHKSVLLCVGSMVLPFGRVGLGVILLH